MKTLGDVAEILRSKNAGPLFITFDIIFGDSITYTVIKESEIITKQEISKAYDTCEDEIQIIYYDAVNAVKVSMPRKYVSGSRMDADIYGCQRHVPISQIAIGKDAIEKLRK
jgi:hypothetical protein